jgi:general secretion pathway protein K
LSDHRKTIKSQRRRGKKRRADRRGVALVMVLGAITVLTVFLTELQEETSSELSAALVERDSVRAEYYARSAINLSRLLIAMEPKIRASIPFISMLGLKQLPVWKYQDMVLGPFNDKESTQSFTSLLNADPATGKNLGLSGGGHFELTIVDEDSKINVNIASQNNFTTRDGLARQLMALMGSPEYNPLFEGRDLDNQFSDRQAICGALIDWADSNNTGNEELSSCDLSDTKTTTGTEDNFYQTAGLGYLRKNAAYDSLQEIRLARGISDDFWSTFVDPDPTNPDKRNVTVWGQGKINLNTANPQTLLSVICSEKVAAVTLCSDVNQIVPFLQLLGMAKAILPPGVPLFGSANELINFLKTGGQSAAGTPDGKSGTNAQAFSISSMILPMFMSALGVTLQPVPITNPGIIRQQLGNTSKIFSIYADGVVPGFRKTTKVRIHAVVDFRLAQGLGETVFSAISGAQSNGGTGQLNNAAAGSISPEALGALQRSDPAGTVIYWRVE